eukprot:81476_1
MLVETVPVEFESRIDENTYVSIIKSINDSFEHVDQIFQRRKRCAKGFIVFAGIAGYGGCCGSIGVGIGWWWVSHGNTWAIVLTSSLIALCLIGICVGLTAQEYNLIQEKKTKTFPALLESLIDKKTKVMNKKAANQLLFTFRKATQKKVLVIEFKVHKVNLPGDILHICNDCNYDDGNSWHNYNVSDLPLQHSAINEERKYDIDENDFMRWRDEDIVNWILTLNNEHKIYEKKLRKALKKAAVTGPLLNELDKRDWERYGITKLKHQVRIIENVNRLFNNINS